MQRLTLVLAMLFSFAAFAQSPQGISYQAVATNTQGEPISNESIAVRFSILQGNPTGPIVYSEDHTTSTDSFGMFNLNIGTGTAGDEFVDGIQSLSWGQSPHFLKVDLDVGASGTYVTLGTQQMMSVPYALYALKSGESTNDQDTDPNNELQTLSIQGDSLLLSNGGAVDLSSLNGAGGQSSTISVECVEMGISPLCGGIGLTSNPTLGPNPDGYTYTLSGAANPNGDYLFNAPHWRKFRISGLPPNYAGKIYIRYNYDYEYNDGQNITSREPVIDDDGSVYVYFTAVGDADCVINGLALEFSSQNQFNFYSNSTSTSRDFEFGYSNGSSLVFTGIVIDF